MLSAALVSLACVLARLLWVFPATYGPRLLSRSLRERDPAPPSGTVAVLAWSGMRGAISLAVALSLSTGPGVPALERDLILFLTFGVILATLVVQGLSLPVLIRALGVHDDGAGEREEAEGRLATARAALARLDELAAEDWVREDTAERLRALYDYRRRRFGARLSAYRGDHGPDGDATREAYEARSGAYGRLLGELLRAQRAALIGLRDEGRIGDETLHRIERDLDLEESRLEV